MKKVIINELPNINKGKPYEERVCVVCKGAPRNLSNYCQGCRDKLRQELLQLL